MTFNDTDRTYLDAIDRASERNRFIRGLSMTAVKKFGRRPKARGTK